MRRLSAHGLLRQLSETRRQRRDASPGARVGRCTTRSRLGAGPGPCRAPVGPSRGAAGARRGRGLMPRCDAVPRRRRVAGGSRRRSGRACSRSRGRASARPAAERHAKSAARISQHLVALIDPLDPAAVRFSQFGGAFDREQPPQDDARSKSRLSASSSRRCLRRCVPEIQPPRRAHRGGHPAHPSIRLLRHEDDFCAVVLSSRSRRRAQTATGEVPERTTWPDGEVSRRHGQDPNRAVAPQLAYEEGILWRARLGACLRLRGPGRPGRSRFRALGDTDTPRTPGEH